MDAMTAEGLCPVCGLADCRRSWGQQGLTHCWRLGYARERELRQADATALSLVSGALCDARTIPVGPALEFGAAVRLLTAERDAAEARARRAESSAKYWEDRVKQARGHSLSREWFNDRFNEWTLANSLSRARAEAAEAKLAAVLDAADAEAWECAFAYQRAVEDGDPFMNAYFNDARIAAGRAQRIRNVATGDRAAAKGLRPEEGSDGQ